MGGIVNAAQIITELTELGIHIEAHGDMLRYTPRPKVPPELVERMKAHKDELLVILPRDPEAPAVAPTECELPQQPDTSDFISVNDWYWEHIDEADREYLLGPHSWPSPCAWCGGRTIHSAACNELRRGWIPVFSFGKYRGRRADTVPKEYIDWLLSEGIGNEDFRAELQLWLESDATDGPRMTAKSNS
jgi:uncharacterized protein (DUF3820 family)